MTHDPALTAFIARTDQFQAEANQALDIAISDYREILDANDNTVAFIATVRTILGVVDPQSQLPDGAGEALTKIAECFACALDRIIKAGAQ